MTNYNYDVADYDQCDCKHNLFTFNNLYVAMIKCMKTTSWKHSIQQYYLNYLINLTKLEQRLTNGTYHFKKGYHFTITERGKTRPILNEPFENRIVKRLLCDLIIEPCIRKYLIYDNYASLPGRGVSLARKRVSVNLQNYYKRNHTNDGYILIMDLSKYYDNIRHDILWQQFTKFVHNKQALKLLKEYIDMSKVDVSYMSDAEYQNCMTDIFDYNEYAKLDKSLRTGKKYMRKHLNIGDQISQLAGILYLYDIDNYVKIVKGYKEYARYNDDSYVIGKTKEELMILRNDLTKLYKDKGITLNPKKTKIVKLSTS